MTRVINTGVYEVWVDRCNVGIYDYGVQCFFFTVVCLYSTFMVAMWVHSKCLFFCEKPCVKIWVMSLGFRLLFIKEKKDIFILSMGIVAKITCIAYKSTCICYEGLGLHRQGRLDCYVVGLAASLTNVYCVFESAAHWSCWVQDVLKCQLKVWHMFNDETGIWELWTTRHDIIDSWCDMYVWILE